MKKYLKLLLAKFRLFFGFCPECNSSAPLLYECKVCNYYNGIFPPSKNEKKIWLKKFRIKHKIDINIWGK